MSDYVYCGGGRSADSSGMDVWKISTANMQKVADIDYGSILFALALDETYLYCAGAGERVWKIQPSDMSCLAVSGLYGGTIYVLTADGDYVYCGGEGGVVWKIRVTDMAKVDESASYGTRVRGLAQHGDYVYCSGDDGNGTNTVWKIRKSDMVKVDESDVYGSGVNRDLVGLVADAEHIYCGGRGGVQRVWKLQQSNMAKVAESANFGRDIWRVCADTDYIYFSGFLAGTIRKIRKTDMGTVADSASYPGTAYGLSLDSDYVYCGGLTDETVWQIRKSDMVKVGGSDSYNSDIRAVVSDLEYVILAVETLAADHINTTGATWNGQLTDGGGVACDCGFEWGLTVALGNTTGTQSKTTGETFSQTISGLASETTYYFRAFATYTGGTVYGDTLSFETDILLNPIHTDVEIVALEALRNIEMSAMGRIYVDEEGNLCYENRYARQL